MRRDCRAAAPAAAVRTTCLVLFLAACTGGPVEPPPAVDPAPARPVLVVGIDGATFDLVDPLVAAGRLPVIAGLLERGARGPLQTIEPTVSPAIWTTVATGRMPEAHGIRGFEGVPGQTMTTLPTTEMRRVPAFWNILSDAGRGVTLVSWWVTWPAEPVLGTVVSDRFTYTRMEAAIADEAPKPGEVHPEELGAELRPLVRRPGAITAEQVRRFLPSFADDEIERLIRGTDYRHGDFLPEFKYVHQADRSTADIALHLMRTRPASVTALGFYGVDVLSHLTWHFMQPERFPRHTIDPGEALEFGELIPRYYEFLDGILGELLQAAGPDVTLLLFSDHGFGPTGNLPWSGGHGAITRGAPDAPDGILVLAGPEIQPGARLDRAHVLDLTPTLLHLQGLPAADDMPGRMLREAFDPAWLAANPPRRIPSYGTVATGRPAVEPSGDPAVDRATIERLRALGYLR